MPNEYPAVLSSIQMVSPRRGWVVGEGAILGTEDGTHWKRQYAGTEAFGSVEAVDAMHAWAVGQRSLLGTTDGGRHWRELGEPAQPLRSVDFVDENRGFGVAGFAWVARNGVTTWAHAGTLVDTADGGLSWRPLVAPCSVESVCFSTLDDGWLVAKGRIYRSEDAGARWREVLHFPRGEDWIATVQCTSQGAAWVLFDGGEGVLSHRPYLAYQSDNRGRTWKAVLVEQYTNVNPEIPAPQGPGSYPGPFSVLSRREAIFVGYTPPADYSTTTMLATHGGRRLGRTQTVPVKQLDPAGASFLSRAQGWIVGRADDGSGIIIATADGGRSWRTQYRLPPT